MKKNRKNNSSRRRSASGRKHKSSKDKAKKQQAKLDDPTFDELLNDAIKQYEAGKLENAKEVAVSLCQLFPDHQVSWKVLGVMQQKMGDVQESLVAMQRSVELGPMDAEAHYNLGVTLLELGHLVEAEVSYKQALALKPDYAEAYSNLGATLQELGRLAESEESYLQAIKLKPNNAAALNSFGNVLKRQHRLDEAEERYSQAIEISPDFSSALVNRSTLYLQKRRYEAALKDSDRCSTGESRALGLEALYGLGQIEEIYRRIARFSDLDKNNLRIAAFEAFVGYLEKKETGHTFCRNPLDFLHFSSISKHIKHDSEFIEGLIEELGHYPTIWEPGGKATKNGSQTPTQTNLFETSSGRMGKLKRTIMDELDTYVSRFEERQCGLISDWPAEKKLHAWHVALQQKGYQEPHIHTDGWVSGVVYLKVVPSLGKNEGAIEFSLNSERYSNPKIPAVIHQPAQGDVILFPSSLHHRTIPFTTAADRIIISFDLMP